MERILYAKILSIAEEYDRLTDQMGQQEVASDPERYRQVAKAQSAIADVVEAFRRYERYEKQYRDAEQMLRDESDHELREMAENEKRETEQILSGIEDELRILLLPKDPNDAKNTIMEIRAGTGGEEAALFVADLYRMYCRLADLKGWRVELMGSNATGIGGYKEISFRVVGDNVYSQLKFEGGVHRVQRVPATEAQGRIHTSAVTVAVLPEAEEVDIHVDPTELQIDVYRSSGAGGQHVNTTDSAVRITHVPTGLVVACQDERSQHKNRAKAMMVLRARLLVLKQEEEDAKRSADRKTQVGSGDRSERIRTYNFPQNRVTDHRIGMTLYNLEGVMEGQVQPLIEALIAADRSAKLTQQ
ncbi:MAG: peptide chain release factor 1 [Candidatus Hydrogenedentes bacterium]|nr:peptide chain release factor 1 [Candidatus Hydrogenedentota bacterium]